MANVKLSSFLLLTTREEKLIDGARRAALRLTVGVSLMDSRICQTSTASPGIAGGFSSWANTGSEHPYYLEISMILHLTAVWLKGAATVCAADVRNGREPAKSLIRRLPPLRIIRDGDSYLVNTGRSRFRGKGSSAMLGARFGHSVADAPVLHAQALHRALFEDEVSFCLRGYRIAGRRRGGGDTFLRSNCFSHGPPWFSSVFSYLSQPVVGQPETQQAAIRHRHKTFHAFAPSVGATLDPS